MSTANRKRCYQGGSLESRRSPLRKAGGRGGGTCRFGAVRTLKPRLQDARTDRELLLLRNRLGRLPFLRSDKEAHVEAALLPQGTSPRRGRSGRRRADRGDGGHAWRLPAHRGRQTLPRARVRLEASPRKLTTPLALGGAAHYHGNVKRNDARSCEAHRARAGGAIVVRRPGRHSSEDVHRVLFRKGPPKPHTLEEMKEGPQRYVRERHARR